jgi:hypothetical protein
MLLRPPPADKGTSDGRAQATTPGVDDSPIIHFALDQLTRDEELRGSRMYGGAPPPRREPDVPAVPRIPAAATVAAPAPPAPSRPEEPRPRVTRKRGSGAGAVAAAATLTATLPVEIPAYAGRSDGESETPPARPDSESPAGVLGGASEPAFATLRDGPAAAVAVASPPPVAVSPVSAVEEIPPMPEQPRTESEASVVRRDVFVPFDESTEHFPRLKYLPTVLQPVWLGLYIFLCLLMLAALALCAAWSRKHSGLLDYHNFGDRRYFLFEYLPTMLGMALLVWLFQIDAALQRVVPFMAMAGKSTVSRSRAAFLDLYPTQYLYPKIQYFRAGRYTVGVALVEFWLFQLTIPLLASCFNALWVGNDDAGKWRWVAVQGVVWATLALYAIHIATLVALAVHLHRNATGLKWDPRSLADVIALIGRANITTDYANSEIFESSRRFRQQLWTRTDRLGYWHTTHRPKDIFYGIGEEGGATRRYSLEHGRIREKPSFSQRSRQSSTSRRAEHSRHVPSMRVDFRDASVTQRYIPWQLRTSSRLAFALTALVLLTGFLVVAFVNRASTRGFFPKLGAASDARGFSPANFLFSFLPALLGMLPLLLWQPIDQAHRRLAPFANMMPDVDGATAHRSLLLDYPYLAPVLATVRAVQGGDWTVALTSATSLLALPIPVLAGGIFWAQWWPATGAVRITAHPAGLAALSVLLALHAGAHAAHVVAGRAAALPHPARCLAELLSWLYMSPLLVDRAFAAPSTRGDMVARLEAPVAIGVHRRERVRPATAEKAPAVPPVPSLRAVEDDEADDDNDDDQHSRLPPHLLAGGAAAEEAGPASPVLPPPINATAPLPPEFHDARFTFGIYVGRDGMEHFGIDRARDDGPAWV